MSDKHTPGPWMYDTMGAGGQPSIAGGSRWLAHLLGTPAVTAANGALIAAAPELLALAERYARGCPECGAEGCPDIGPVIAKARGEV